METDSSEAGDNAKVSSKFNAENADLILLSKDGVVFRVHRMYLEANSPVFKDMFELGKGSEKSAELPQVQLEETSDVLEVGLPYVYPAFLEPFELDLNGDLGAIRMFEKYEIARGTEAVLASLVLNNAVSTHLPKSASHIFELGASFVLASYLGVTAVRDTIVHQILRTDCRWQDLQPTLEAVAAKVQCSTDDCSKLGKLLSQRRHLIDIFRQRTGAHLASQLRTITSPGDRQTRAQSMSAAFEMWEHSAYITSVTGIVELEKEHGSLVAEAKKAVYLTMGTTLVSPFVTACKALEGRLKTLPCSLEA